MARFNIVLDKRVPKPDGVYNLAIRLCHRRTVMFINLWKMPEKDYDTVYIKKSMDKNSIKIREMSNASLTKCENIFREMKVFSPDRFRQRYKEETKKIEPKTLLLRDLFERYTIDNEMKLKTRVHYRMTGRIYETFQKDVNIWDIDVDFLKRFEKHKLESGCSRATLNSYSRHLRAVINYFRLRVPVIPTEYEYPFGRGKYVIGSYTPMKSVLTQDEIKRVLAYNCYRDLHQEYALTVWRFLYYGGGANFADLMRLRESQISQREYIFTRKKTETTRVMRHSDIRIPITEPLAEVIQKLRDFKQLKVDRKQIPAGNPFLLGLLQEGYTEEMFANKIHKYRSIINTELKDISVNMGLSVTLQLKSARDCFATTLYRQGVSIDVIGNLMGHSNSTTTMAYLASLDFDTALAAVSKLVI